MRLRGNWCANEIMATSFFRLAYPAEEWGWWRQGYHYVRIACTVLVTL